MKVNIKHTLEYLISFAAGALFTYLVLYLIFFSPYSSDTKEVSVVVDKGWNFKQISAELESKNLVTHWWAIYLIGKLHGESITKIKAGEYLLSPSLTPYKILERLLKGEIVYHTLVVPEGSNIKDVKNIIEKSTLATSAEIDKVLRDRAFMSRLGVQGGSLEGYLFPETYKFTRPDSAEFIITTMVQQTFKVMKTQDIEKRARELGYSIPQRLTLASIIEKETGLAADRGKISSVFHNRLKIGMKLQSDPTVIYGISNFNGNLTKENLQTPTPYNTYMKSGLPPTPICNPGLAAINAALHPEDTDYLYFVAKGDGTSYFSPSYARHQEAVRTYQLMR